MTTVPVDARFPHPASPLQTESHDRSPQPPRRSPTSPVLPPTPSPAGWPKIPLPNSAPAYTSTFPINSEPSVPHIKVEHNSPSAWSEPRQPRDVFYAVPYRHPEEWQAAHQHQQQQHAAASTNAYPQYQAHPAHPHPTPQYQYWSTPSYPNMPQQHQQNEEKRRQAEIQKQRRHVCPVCDKRFNRPSSLNTHMSVHTGAKPYQCLREGCGRRFSVSSNLRRHERTHDARARPKSATPARPVPAPSFAAGYYSGNNYYMQPQFDYTMPSSGLRDYAVVGGGVNASTSASASTPMSIGVAPPQRRESAPSYYQSTPAPSPTPPQMFQAHKSMST